MNEERITKKGFEYKTRRRMAISKASIKMEQQVREDLVQREENVG
jgi:hypothetical protein